MSARYRHPAEFTLAEIGWIVASRQTEDLGMALGAETVAGARQRWTRVVRAGGMTMRDADRFATRLGYHPANLWDDWFVRCADLDDRYDMWRTARRRLTERRRSPRVRARPTIIRCDDEHVEWVKWCDRRERVRSLVAERAAR